MLEKEGELERIRDRKAKGGGGGGHRRARVEEDHRDQERRHRDERRDDIEMKRNPLAGEELIELRTRVGGDERARLRFKSLRGAKGANGGYAGERLREL